MNTISKREVKFYSAEEKKELMILIKSDVKPSVQNLKDFCEKYNRRYKGVEQKYYAMKHQLIKDKKEKKSSNLVIDKSKNITNNVHMSKSEFKIPIKDWTVKTENGQLFLIARF